MIKQDELLCLIRRYKLNVSGGKTSKKKHKTWPFRKQGAKENFKQTNFGKSDKRLQEMKVNGKAEDFATSATCSRTCSSRCSKLHKLSVLKILSRRNICKSLASYRSK